jgi:hypothetical protein
MRIRRSDIVCLSILLILQALLFSPAAFNPSNLLASKYSDAITQHLPHQVFIRQTLLQNKRFPLWNPYECAGTPAFPNPLYLTLALPHVLLFPLPPPLAMNVGFFLHVFLAGALAYALARKIGCSSIPSLLAALVFSLGSRPLSLVQGGLYPIVAYLPYVPLLFLAAEQCVTHPGRLASILLAICMMLALLTGEIQLLLYSIPLILSFSLLRCWIAPDRMETVASPGRALCSVFAGMLLAIPLSAFYLLPARNLYPLLTRSWPLGEARFSMMPSLSTLRLILNPKLLSDFNPSTELPWESALYFGLAPLTVTAWAFFKKSYRRDLHLWGSLAAVALIFSLQELKAIHHPLNTLFPSLASFRNPGRMLFFFPFFAAMLAGRALHLFSSENPAGRGRHAVRSWPCIFVIVSFVLCGLFVSTSQKDITSLTNQYCQRFSSFFGSQHLALIDKNALREEASSFKAVLLGSLAFQAAIIAALFLIFILREKITISSRVLGILLLGIAYADLSYFGKPHIETHRIEEIYPPSALYRFLERTEHKSRLLDASASPVAPFWTALPFFQSLSLRLSRIGGYTPVNLISYVRHVDLIRGRSKTARPRWGVTVPSVKYPMLLSLLNTGFLISESSQVGPPFALSKEFRDVPVYRQFLGAGVIPRLFLYRNDDPLPEAWLVPEAVTCAPAEEDRMMTKLDFRSKALLPPGARTLSRGEPYRAVPISRIAPDLIGIDLETRLPSYLCLSEVWTPGWEATDRGKPVEVVRIDKILRGIYLDPGRHSLRLSYRPPGLRVGIVISILTAVALIAAASRARK